MSFSSDPSLSVMSDPSCDADPKASPATADDVAADDPHKAEKLAKIGHGDDEASEGGE